MSLFYTAQAIDRKLVKLLWERCCIWQPQKQKAVRLTTDKICLSTLSIKCIKETIV